VREHREHRGHDHHRRLPDEQELAPVVPVGERAGGQRQQGNRDELGRGKQLDQEGRLGLLLDEPRLGDGLHPVADVARQRTEPDPAERRMPQHGEGSARRARRSPERIHGALF
jgi:hypothetical protein